jgi:hypothetical protein
VRLNGLEVVATTAIRELGHPLVSRYQKAIVLGSLREDVWYIPGAKVVFEHLSFSHFYRPGLPGGIIPVLWPGPRRKANKFFARAVAEHGAGRVASGFVQLGRVVHLLTDMCCPVHAHRTVHETDPFEWYVEANKKKLGSLPVPAVADQRRASDLIEGLATFTQAFATDETNHAPGKLLKRLGLLESVSAKEAGEQARALIPMAAGYTVALLRLYLREIGAAVSHAGAATAAG